MQFVDGVRPAQAGAAVLELGPRIKEAKASSLPPSRLFMDIRPATAVMAQPAAPLLIPELPEATVIPRDYSRSLRWAAIGVAGLSLTLSGVFAWPRLIQRTDEATAAPVASSTNAKPATNNAATPSASALTAAESLALQKTLDQFTTAAPSGVVVVDLKTGATASKNDRQVFTSASLYKLFVAHGIYKQIDSGQRRLSDKLGSMTVEQCLNLSITVSDNGCAEALGGLLGWNKYNPTLKSLGFEQTKFASPMQTSAHDIALFYERLYKGTLLSPASSKHFLDLLRAQHINNRLPVGLPEGTMIAHKTGDLDGYVHDAGIVYGPKTDYIVVMTSGPWSSPASAPTKFAELSKLLYEQFSK